MQQGKSKEIADLVCLLFMSLCLLIQPYDVFAQDTSLLSVKNFDQTLELTVAKKNKSSDLQTVSTQYGHQLALSNRLIVKLAADINIEKLIANIAHIKTAQLLYQGHGFNYFSLTLSSQNALQSTFLVLQKHKDILLLQPDLLQLNNKASKTQPRPQNYQLIKEKRWPSATGHGVKLAIIDDGFNFQHPDLQQARVAFQYDVSLQILDASAKTSNDSHGTRVAGIIAAKSASAKVSGIAPDVELIAIRHVDTWTSKTLISFQIAKLAGADIINCSWHSDILLQPVRDVVDDLARYGRQGKGLAVIFSAGNMAQPLKKYNHEAAIDSAIVVGAADARGHRLAFSNYGDTVDVYMQGTPVLSTASRGGYQPFSGTSLAAAIASAYAALILSLNPEMPLPELRRQLIQAGAR